MATDTAPKNGTEELPRWSLDEPTTEPRHLGASEVQAYRVPDQMAALAHRPRTVHRRLSARPAISGTQRCWTAVRALLAPDDRGVRLTDAIDRMSVPVATGRRIDVVGAHGGAGATTVALCLASLASRYRGDPVALVDASSAHGGLLTRLSAAPGMSMEAASRHLNDPLRPAVTVMRGQGPHVFSPAADDISKRVIDGIQRHAGVTFVDTSSAAIKDTQSASRANVTIVVAENTVRGLAAVHGYVGGLLGEGLPRERVMVIFTERVTDSGVPRRWLAGQVLSILAVPVFCVPQDRHLAGAAQVHLDALASETSIALTRIAAAAIEASTGIRAGTGADDRCDAADRSVPAGADAR